MPESLNRVGEQNSPEGYEELAGILDGVAADKGVRLDECTFMAEALEQAAGGKGRERHANAKPWHEQPILEIQHVLGNDGFALGQAMKKVQEAERLPWDRGREEFKGAIVYLAAAHLFLRGTTAPEVCGARKFPSSDQAMGLSMGVAYRLVLFAIAAASNEKMRLVRLKRIETAIRTVAVCALQLDKDRASE